MLPHFTTGTIEIYSDDFLTTKCVPSNSKEDREPRVCCGPSFHVL